MHISSDSLRAFVYSAAALIILVFGAAELERAQLLRTNMLTQEYVPLDGYVDGTVPRPFAYRVLLPQILRVMNAVTPESIATQLDSLGRKIGWSGPEQKYSRDIVWLAAIQFASLIGYALVGASLFSSLLGSDALWVRRVVAPVLLLFLAPIVYKGLGHIYDFTALFFSASLLWAMARERHAFYLLIFAVSCFNKETTLLVSIAYAAVFFRRMDFGRYALMLAAQFAIFLAIYVPIKIIYSANPGSVISVHWDQQIPYYASHLKNGFVLAMFCAALALLLLLIFFRWRDKPQFLRRAAVMIVPQLALLFYGAAPGEVRNLYEVVPLLSLLILCSLSSIYGSAYHARMLELKT